MWAKNPFQGAPESKTTRVARGEISLQTFDVSHKGQKHLYVIFHNGSAKNHAAILDIGAKQSIISMGGWEIIKHHGSSIYSQRVDMGGYSKVGRRLQIGDAKGVVKNCMDGKRYLVIVRKSFFNPNS